MFYWNIIFFLFDSSKRNICKIGIQFPLLVIVLKPREKKKEKMFDASSDFRHRFPIAATIPRVLHNIEVNAATAKKAFFCLPFFPKEET